MANFGKITLLSASLIGISAAAAQAASFTADLNPLNDSGVGGSVLLELSDDRETLTVTLDASGFEPNRDHVGHIHGLFADGEVADSQTPTLDQDSDGDGFVELREGAPIYGPVVLPIETINTPDGSAAYTQTYDLSDSGIFADNVLTSDEADKFGAADLFPLEFREIVYHGLSVEPGAGAGTDGEIDGTGGYKAILPVAAGEIVAIDSGIDDGEDRASTPEPGLAAALAIAGLGSMVGLRRRENG